MTFLLILLNTLILVYIITKGYSGVLLSYILFFELIPITLFRHIGFPLLGYIVYILLVIIYIAIYYKKEFRIKKINYIIKNKLLWAIAIFVIIMVVQFYYVNIYNYIDLEIPIKYLTRYLPLILVVLLFCNREKTLSQIGTGLILFGFIYFLILLFDVGFTELSRREMTEEAHANVLGISRAYGMIFIFSFISLFENKLSKPSIIYIGGVLISLFVMFLLSTRQVLIVILPIILLYYLITKKINLKVIFRIIGGLSILVFMAYGLVLSFDFLVLERMLDLLDYQESYRYQRYLFAISILSNLTEIPLMGFGAGYFSYITGIGSAHNLFFGMVLEYGLLGFIAWFLLIVGGIITVIKLLNSNHLEYKIKVIPLFWMVYASSTFVSGDSTGSRNLWVLTGLLVSLNYFNYVKSIDYKYLKSNAFKEIYKR